MLELLENYEPVKESYIKLNKLSTDVVNLFPENHFFKSQRPALIELSKLLKSMKDKYFDNFMQSVEDFQLPLRETYIDTVDELSRASKDTKKIIRGIKIAKEQLISLIDQLAMFQELSVKPVQLKVSHLNKVIRDRSRNYLKIFIEKVPDYQIIIHEKEPVAVKELLSDPSSNRPLVLAAASCLMKTKAPATKLYKIHFDGKTNLVESLDEENYCTFSTNHFLQAKQIINEKVEPLINLEVNLVEFQGFMKLNQLLFKELFFGLGMTSSRLQLMGLDDSVRDIYKTVVSNLYMAEKMFTFWSMTNP
ncbi:hypothetical protein O9G_000861 [Rozella allomycis CSF55]|uniref:Uncharacterized protein n=1 Tax=Rozella allomycis (strain CSF55) TaxID=988480 RepID=A0A075AR67_ROZAC|nr:hypothetical protein O9G_000861 [Rozella allomycis CSF55]|eukprot:EPZ32786.1 hypothetical protein O9G_000861 [Rozella allomycis CSF55]